MRKIICDRCGAEIGKGERIGYLAANWRMAKDGTLMKDNPYEDMDFCEQCMWDIVSVIDFKVIAAPEEDEAVPDPEQTAEGGCSEEDEGDDEVVERMQEAEAKKSRGRVDPGKFREMVKTGKSPEEIMEHFGISKYTYQKYYRAFEKEYNRGFSGAGEGNRIDLY